MAMRGNEESLPILSCCDGVAVRNRDMLMLVARIALGSLFVVHSYFKVTGLAAFTASLPPRGVPVASLIGPIAAFVEFIGGWLIVLGLATRYASLLMILFVVCATISSHRFWEFTQVQQYMGQLSHFMKNIAIIGGLLFLFACGPGPYSLDAWLRKRN